MWQREVNRKLDTHEFIFAALHVCASVESLPKKAWKKLRAKGLCSGKILKIVTLFYATCVWIVHPKKTKNFFGLGLVFFAVFVWKCDLEGCRISSTLSEELEDVFYIRVPMFKSPDHRQTALNGKCWDLARWKLLTVRCSKCKGFVLSGTLSFCSFYFSCSRGAANNTRSMRQFRFCLLEVFSLETFDISPLRFAHRFQVRQHGWSPGRALKWKKMLDVCITSTAAVLVRACFCYVQR